MGAGLSLKLGLPPTESEMERLHRIQELIGKKAEIDRELAELKQLVKDEKAAFTAMRKPRKRKES
jgi:hypothetical protein